MEASLAFLSLNEPCSVEQTALQERLIYWWDTGGLKPTNTHLTSYQNSVSLILLGLLCIFLMLLEIISVHGFTNLNICLDADLKQFLNWSNQV